MALGHSIAGDLVAHERPELKPLFSLAVGAARRAYARYSEFCVGAAVELSPGVVFAGCNVENSAYSVVTCAERNALAACTLGRSEGDEKATPLRLVVVAFKRGRQQSCSPCGACRQAITELNPECEVHFFYGETLELVSRPARELLPFSFTQ